ncbi:MAG: Jag N-terminal domain-containing protein [Faecalibacterium sp.]|jgi:spoIIIJ-associated protein|nr:Jag N-terminal domain-containing protein [Faecalibacterium sp.]
MTREVESTGKTVEEAYAAGCAELGVSADEINVSYEVIDFPAKKLFKTIPARVKVTVTEPDAPAAPAKQQPAAPKAEKAAPAAAPAKAAPANEAEVPIDLSQNAKVRAAVEYLEQIAGLMGVTDAKFSAVQKGEATIVKVEGEELGALIGRRGETMESLSYLGSLVANRMEGDYVKLGLDVAGYRGKREQDLTVLAQRIGEKVRRTGRAFAMEPMNPYERRIIHSAVTAMDGLRSESKGEGKDRRVVIYSTAPDASTEPPETERHGRPDGGRSFHGNGGRGPNRGGYRGPRSGGYHGDHSDRGPNRGGYSHGPRPSGVPERNFETRTVDEAAPVAPKRTEHVDDFSDFGFGKIDL